MDSERPWIKDSNLQATGYSLCALKSMGLSESMGGPSLTGHHWKEVTTLIQDLTAGELCKKRNLFRIVVRITRKKTWVENRAESIDVARRSNER